MKRIFPIMIVSLLLATLGISGDPRLLEEALKTKEIVSNFVRGFANEYYREMEEAYSAYIPNIDLDIKKMNKTIEGKLIPCMNGETLVSGYSQSYGIKNSLNSFISFALSYQDKWRLGAQDLNGFANAMVNTFNQIFSWSYSSCVFNYEDPNVEYHGIDYLFSISSALRADAVTQRLLTLYDNSNCLENFERAMNNLMGELRKGLDNLDLFAIGREFCKAYLEYDPLPALPTPAAALHFFNSFMTNIAVKLPLLANVPDTLTNDIITGTKCLMSRSPSNITKFMNFLTLRFANFKLGTTFNLTNEDSYRVTNEIKFVILAINNFFRGSLGCFNSTAQGYSVKGYLLYAIQNVQNWVFSNDFYNNIYSTCINQGLTQCFNFSVYTRNIFLAIDNNVINSNIIAYDTLAYQILQLFNMLFPFTNYHPVYQATQYSENYQGDVNDYPYNP